MKYSETLNFENNSWWKKIILLTYIALLFFNISNHEPWFDEAQAWLLARDTSPAALLTTYLRYEGSPGLWHLILMIPAKLGLPYASLNIIAGVIASMGVYIFLRYSPFPALIKILYPFSFFAFYQYAVVARSYVLLPTLLFLAAVHYKNRISRPYMYFILLILISNISLHGTIIALGLVFAHSINVLKVWSALESNIRHKQFYSLAAFGIMMVLLFFELKPPADIVSVASLKLELKNPFSRSLYIFTNSLSANTTEALNKPESIETLGKLMSLITIYSSTVWFLYKKKLLEFLVPFSGLCILFIMIYANKWHLGTVFYLWLFAMWISFEQNSLTTVKYDKLIKGVMTGIIALMLTVQIHWSYSSSRFDYYYNYSASKEVAEFIKDNRFEDKRIFISGFHCISILPYFDRNIFSNYKSDKSFWFWSKKNNIYSDDYLDIAKYDNPEIIILGIKYYYDKIAATDNTWTPDIEGYKLIKLFNGNLYWKNKPLEKDSFAVYEKL